MFVVLLLLQIDKIIQDILHIKLMKVGLVLY